jgi:glycosyltransferase involved in cell wall biosynthesis
MKFRRMIFHIPNSIPNPPKSGSEIRPTKMLEAFKNIGYEVDIVMGYVSDRKRQIENIKKNIKNGVKYEFLYSESSTMPTALTEKHHLPVAPFLDFDFFKFCKQHNIKIGLFYRDVYWVFDDYKKDVSFLKRKFADFFYYFDLKNYKKYLDVLYLPSTKMLQYIPFDFDKKVFSLYPAIEEKKNKMRKMNKLSFIYVGGLGSVYDLTLFSKVIDKFDNVDLNFCIRENEWNCNEYKYKYNNIKVHHLYGGALGEVYNQSAIALYFIKPDILWNFAMGVKLFEYIAYKKPIVAVKGTAVGSFVEENDIGWVIEYDEKILEKLLLEIQNNPKIVEEKIKNIEKIIPLNTWEARAKQVEQDLLL